MSAFILGRMFFLILFLPNVKPSTKEFQWQQERVNKFCRIEALCKYIR